MFNCLLDKLVMAFSAGRKEKEYSSVGGMGVVGGRLKKEGCTAMHIADSHCYIAETNSAL